MKAILTTLILSLVATSCCPPFCPDTVAVTRSAHVEALKNEGWVSMRPQGTPDSLSSWNKYGPGAIVRPGSKGELYGAKEIIGDENVTLASTDKEPYSMPNWSKISTYSVDLDADVTGILDTGNESLFKSVGASAVSVSYGKTTRSAPLTIVQVAKKFNEHPQMDSLTKKALRLRQAHLVYDVLYTDDFTYQLGRYNENKVFVPINIDESAKAKIEAGGFSISGTKLNSSKPIFIAYRLTESNRLKLDK